MLSSGVYYMYNVYTIVHKISLHVYCIVSKIELKHSRKKGDQIAWIMNRPLLNGHNVKLYKRKYSLRTIWHK
jgi:hypothetical protein